ncbi:MAG: hypothetical protein KGD58_14005 [Candidatus Lokiarchaeota archaeon]|nr:hypothetical protein [Candidatus Lokiarchaeota archaeon]
MDTTSFYFETYNFKCRKHVKSSRSEEISEKITSEKIYSELKNIGENDK